MKLLNIKINAYNNFLSDEATIGFEEEEFNYLKDKNAFFNKTLFLEGITMIYPRIMEINEIFNPESLSTYREVNFQCRKFFDTEEEYENYH